MVVRLHSDPPGCKSAADDVLWEHGDAGASPVIPTDDEPPGRPAPTDESARTMRRRAHAVDRRDDPGLFCGRRKARGRVASSIQRVRFPPAAPMRVRCYGSTVGFHPTSPGPTPGTRTTPPRSGGQSALVAPTGESDSHRWLQCLASVTAAHGACTSEATVRLRREARQNALVAPMQSGRPLTVWMQVQVLPSARRDLGRWAQDDQELTRRRPPLR